MNYQWNSNFFVLACINNRCANKRIVTLAYLYLSLSLILSLSLSCHLPLHFSLPLSPSFHNFNRYSSLHVYYRVELIMAIAYY